MNVFRELLVAVVALAVGAAAALVPAHHQSRTYWTGVLQADQANYRSFAGAGINRVTLELRWDAYEPSNGSFSDSYIAQQQDRVTAARRAGLQVVLDPGLHFPASWVFGLSGQTHFVDQYGDTWNGGDGSNPANAVFDPAVRTAEASYLARIGRDFAGDFVAVRAGGLLTGELRLPDGKYDGHVNSLWMYDTAAQQASPDRGWKPGSGTRAQARASIAYYLSSMDGYVRWLLTQLSADFPLTQLQLLEPGWGIRPGQVTAAIDAGLTGSTPVEQGDTLQAGLDYAGEVAVASTFANTVVYTTWLDAADSGPGLAGAAPADYLHLLAQQYDLPLAGENTGNYQTDSEAAAALRTCISRVSQLGVQGFTWFTGSDLIADDGVSLSQFRSATS